MSRVFHIIDSIKGGCGKTTFSIMLTEYLERKYRETAEKEQKKATDTELSLEKRQHACLLDVDFIGTGMIDLFFNQIQKEEHLKRHIYLTDKIRGFQVDDKKYITAFPICGRTLYVGFGDPNFKTKEKFRCSSKYNYTTIIGYGIFRSGIKKVLEKGALEQQIKGQVGSIVLDMSPGLDAYSESVKESIFDKRHSSFLETSDRRNYYLMVGMDYSHLSSAKDYFSEFLRGEDKKNADQIFIVFDDVLQFFTGKPGEDSNTTLEKEQYNSRIDDFCQVLKHVPEDTQEKIHFLALNPFYKYSEILHTMNNLSVLSGEESERKGIFNSVPFRYAALKKDIKTKKYKLGAFNEKQQGELLKWLI